MADVKERPQVIDMALALHLPQCDEPPHNNCTGISEQDWRLAEAIADDYDTLPTEEELAEAQRTADLMTHLLKSAFENHNRAYDWLQDARRRHVMANEQAIKAKENLDRLNQRMKAGNA